VLPGTVAEDVAHITGADRETVVLEHPTGSMEAVISTVRAADGSREVISGGTLRTARRLMAGEVYVPARAWG
jgi:2-methylaconitate cis-trans-isomerase PrpF